MELQLEQYDSYSLYKIILLLKNKVYENFYFLGKALKILHDTKGYRNIASHITTWDGFLNEIGISHGKAFYLMKIVEKFDATLANINAFPSISRLVQLLPYADAMDKEEKEEWIHKAINQSRLHWRSEIKKLASGVDILECEHNEYELFMKCKKCGRFLKHKEIDT